MIENIAIVVVLGATPAALVALCLLWPKNGGAE